MPTTPQGYPYPAPSDAPNLSQYYQNIASAVDQRTTTTVANATARTSLANKYDGMIVYQSDTQRYYKYDLGNTRWDYLNGPWFTWTPTLIDSASTTVTATTINTQGDYIIQGGRITFQVSMKFNGGVNGGVGNLQLVMPSGVTSAVSQPQQYSITAGLWTPTGSANWPGHGYVPLNSNRVSMLFPIDSSHSNTSDFRNATGAGATGTGVPLIAGSYPLSDGAYLTVAGSYRLSSWPAL